MGEGLGVKKLEKHADVFMDGSKGGCEKII